jgi:protein O-GlcNAc transferase
MHAVSQLFDRAADLHRKGELEAAESVYLELLAAQPGHFDGLQMLGILRYQQQRLPEALSLLGAALRAKPDFPPALLNYGLVLDALRRREEALACYDHALALAPSYVEAHHNRGLVLRGLARPAQALASFDQALSIRPDFAEAHFNRGNALQDLDRPADALASFDRTLAIKPDHVGALNNRGLALLDLHRPAEALASFDRALAIKPGHAEAHYNRGSVLRHLDRPAEALASFERALAIKPDHVGALNNRGLALLGLHRPAEALASFERVLAVRPDHVRALNNLGNTLQDLRRPAEALAAYERALTVQPNYAEALYNRGIVLRDLKRPAEALASLDQALSIDPRHVDALNNRGIVLRDLDRPREALACYDQVLAIKPDYVDAQFNRGGALRDLKRPAEACASFGKVLAIKPDHRYGFGAMADAALVACDWARTETLAGELEMRITQRGSIVTPFTLLTYGCEPSLQLECATKFIADKLPVPVPRPGIESTRRHDKIRIAYLSPDYRRHATAVLTAELFELHDRARFEIIGISFGPDDQSDVRARLMRAFDQFHDVRARSDHDTAKLLRDLHPDIAIDLAGHTQDARLEIFAHRPAPIQVSYLGYPGTTGADFMDYVIADRIVLPFNEQQFYSEKIVHLPDCYQVNDSKRQIAARGPTRHEAGLPDEGFVFCCFNNNHKITAPVFGVWMRLLAAFEDSVLWLLRDNGDAQENLRKEAAARGIDPTRLVFADRLSPEEHLARHHLADLFLDTLPYNAHTTASDALWAGLPVLTCRGDSFPGRVAASILCAAGLPELVTRDLGEYEALALRLAADALLLRGLRQRLAQNRATCPLFDTDRFRRHIESAYTTMWELQRRGESPRSFSVEPVQ